MSPEPGQVWTSWSNEQHKVRVVVAANWGVRVVVISSSRGRDFDPDERHSFTYRQFHAAYRQQLDRDGTGAS